MAQITDLKRAFDALNGKQAVYTTLFNYAEGRQPVRYATDRLQEAFRDLNTHFTQNWCSVIINAALDRLTLKGWDAKDKTTNDKLDELWTVENLQLDAYEAHYGALVTGEAFIIAWDSGDGVEIYYNDPRMCHVFYNAERPKEKQFAAKWWSDGNVWYMTLYYPDRLEYYVTKSKDQPGGYGAFKPMETPTADNPFGVIPVFHLRTNRRKARGELDDIITLQDAVNKLLADMMVAGEFGAFPQRYIISQADTSNLKNGPHIIWEIPAGDGQSESTQVGQFAATDLNNYLNAMDKLANSIAIISRTPKHYFYNAGASLSGEALIAMEAPLTKKIGQRQENFSVVWRELGAFLVKLTGGGDVEPADITPIWEPAESVQPYTEAQTRVLAVNAGIPLNTQLRREGWGTDEIEAMEKDAADEKKKNAALAPVLLDEARARGDNSNDNPLGNGNEEPA